MAPRSLLRHIFRHGPPPKDIAAPLPPPTSKPLPNLPPPVAANAPHSPTSPVTPSRTPEPHILEDIPEEPSGDTVSAQHDTTALSITETFAALDLDVSTFTTRDLLEATVDEAKLATHAHLDTINITLLLLDALDGFSATIAELNREMQGKKVACEEKLRIFEGIDGAVEQMQFSDEKEAQDQASKGEVDG